MSARWKTLDTQNISLTIDLLQGNLNAIKETIRQVNHVAEAGHLLA
jgi:hypothetical protein